MFQKLMNNFYYGKSGKADMTPEDLPTNRMQLFWEMLRVRLSALIRLNLMYVVCWLPAMIILLFTGMGAISSLSEIINNPDTATMTASELMNSVLFGTLLIMIPCIAITGPCTAGVAFVTRNWARDEHAFIWSDFKDAVKANWKQALITSAITSVLPFLVYVCWNFYSSLAASNVIMFIPQVLVLMIGLAWSLMVSYMYPLMVTYQLTYKQLVRNVGLLAIGRLPSSVGMRLLHCVPVIIAALVATFLSSIWAMLGLFLYYCVIGFGLSRFVTASITNGVMDKYINSHIEGAVVNRGLYIEKDDEDDDEDDGKQE